MSCRQTKCAKEHAIYMQQTKQIMSDSKKLTTLKQKKKLSNDEYEKRMSKLGNSAAERKGMRDDIECGLRHCFHEYRTSLNYLLSGVERICKEQKKKDGCEKVKELKASIKKGMLSVEQYASLHKLFTNIDLKV